MEVKNESNLVTSTKRKVLGARSSGRKYFCQILTPLKFVAKTSSEGEMNF